MKKNQGITLEGHLIYSTKNFETDIVQLPDGQFEAIVSIKGSDTSDVFIRSHFVTFRSISFVYIYEKAKEIHQKLEDILSDLGTH